MKAYRVSDPFYSSILKYVCTGPIPANWSQPFTFKPHSYALYQRGDGPCGLLSSIQANICISVHDFPNAKPESLLVNAILDIMYKIRKCFVICTNIDENSKTIEWFSSQDKKTASEFIIKKKWYLEQNATVLFTTSIVILLGPVWLNSYCFSDPFILEGQTNLTFVLLLLTGDVIDSFHDGDIITNGVVFKGALTEQPVGFVSISESEEYQSVGLRFSNPTKNIWLGYYGGHFTTIVKLSDELFIEFDGLNQSSIFNVVNHKHIFYSKLMH